MHVVWDREHNFSAPPVFQRFAKRNCWHHHCVQLWWSSWGHQTLTSIMNLSLIYSSTCQSGVSFSLTKFFIHQGKCYWMCCQVFNFLTEVFIWDWVKPLQIVYFILLLVKAHVKMKFSKDLFIWLLLHVQFWFMTCWSREYCIYKIVADCDWSFMLCMS